MYDDPDFNAGMVHVAAVFVNADAAGAAGVPGDQQSPYGGDPESYVPVEGYATLKCRLMPEPSAVRGQPAELPPRVTRRYYVQYADPIELDDTFMLQWDDAVSKVTRKLFVEAGSREHHGIRHHQSAYAVEYRS